MQEVTSPVNQTHFSYEEPLFEQPPVLPSEADETIPPTVWYRTRKGMLLIAGGVIIGLLLLLSVLVYLAPKNPGVDSDLFAPVPSPSPSLTPNQVKIMELGTELDAADPAKQEFPFPPVMMDITLPDPNKRN